MLPSFRAFILEMAAPREEDRAKTYFHGTPDEHAAQEILRSGHIMPGNPNGTRKGLLAPVKGKTYITPHLHYGQIYAIGGDMAGHKWDKQGHGYLFTVKGEHLQHIQPDEDSVGEMAAKHARGEAHQDLPFLGTMMRSLNPSTQKKMKEGWYAQWASGGKQMLRQMSDAHKHALIDRGAHIAHDGPLPIDQAWKIDKSKTHLLKKDGSNFFDIAERVR